jgi:hypothetical protein
MPPTDEYADIVLPIHVGRHRDEEALDEVLLRYRLAWIGLVRTSRPMLNQAQQYTAGDGARK